MQKKSFGNLGENIAVAYLKNKGYRFVGRNFRSRCGEIDLIFLDRRTLVFVEVKTRDSDCYGAPEAAITRFKLRALTRTAQYYKSLHPELPDALRIDLVAITTKGSDGRRVRLNHIQNITS